MVKVPTRPGTAPASSRELYPEVRGSHLAGQLERDRALRQLERNRRKRAKRKARKQGKTVMNQQPLLQITKKPRKPRVVNKVYLDPAVTEELVRRISQPHGRETIEALYNAHAPSKTASGAATSAVGALLRKYQRQTPYSMAPETHRIWTAIYRGEAPPNAIPVPATSSAPAPTTTLQALPEDLDERIAAAVSKALKGFVRQTPELDYVSEIKRLVADYVARRWGASKVAYQTAWNTLYLEYQTAHPLPEGDRDESLVRRIVSDGHGADLLAIAKSLFSEK